MIFFGNVFTHFLVDCLFYKTSYKNSLHILDINSYKILIIGFADIFPIL